MATGGKPFAAAPDSGKRSTMGIVIYALGLKREAEKRRGKGDLFEPTRFLDYCHGLGAGGVQVPLGARDEGYASAIRAKAARLGMFVEAILDLPRDAAGVGRFDAEVQTARRAGATVARTAIMPGRRYEQFKSLDEFRESLRRGRKSLELAEPVLVRHRLRLAVENHKDHRLPEMLETLKGLSSPWIGACVDVGNNIALLEDPLGVVKGLGPFAMTVHLKDQAVATYQDGFLLADMPLGRGCLELKAMVDVLRKAKPDIHFCLEVITRDPLKVPCLTDAYWATLDDRRRRDLGAIILGLHLKSVKDVPRISDRPLEKQVEVEAANVATSLAYARDHLAM